MLLINKELKKLKDDAKFAFPPKLIELVKKPFNLTRIGKKKPHWQIFHFLTCFIKPIGQPCFCFAKAIKSLINGLAIGEAKLMEGKVAIGFS